MASSGSERRPVIGLTTYMERAQLNVWDTEFALLPYTYVDAVSRAGGVPVLLPPVDSRGDGVVDTLDGLIISGGADIDPSLYGEKPHRETSGTRPGRDRWEITLLNRALDNDVPLLGVCRGAQLLNVALGGTLTQHLPDAVGHDGHRPRLGKFGTSRVRLREDSRVAEIVGDVRDVPCHHHQAFARVAPGLEVVGRAEDGTVEAVELAGRRFVVAIQWHPEEDKSDVRLFEALIDAAQRG